jgi:hypothetical protein
MSTGFQPESQFDFNAYQRELAKQPASNGGRWFLGLMLVVLGFLFLGGLVVVGGVCYVASNFDRWLVGLGREAIVAMINDSEIPVAEKSDVIFQVDRIVNAYKQRKINAADLEKALSELGEAPALRVLALYGLEDIYLTSSGLTDDEIAAGRHAYERALRGVYEDKITSEDLYAVLGMDAEDRLDADRRDAAPNAVSEDQGETITLVSDSRAKALTDEEVRHSLARLKRLADEAGIPDEPFHLDISDEVKKIVDHLLAGKE